MKTKFFALKPLLKRCPFLLLTLFLPLSFFAVKQGGDLVIAFGFNPRHVNPAIQSGVAAGIPGSQVFASPVRFDENFDPQPYLAESWQWSDDRLALTLNLVKNAKFHDGRPVTSEDVKFSLEINKKHHPFKTKFEAVEAIETPDEHTVVLKLSRPHPSLLLALSPVLAPVLPKHVYDDGRDLLTHPKNVLPVGSGPFRVTEFKAGQHIVMERFEDFFIPGRPYLDRVVFKIVTSPGNQIIGLKNKEFDLSTATTISIRDWKKLGEEDHLTATREGFEAIGPLNWLAINTRHEILGNKKVRQAIAYAIDKDFVVGVLHNGATLPANGPVAPGSPFYAENVNDYRLDLERAKRLLDEAGYPVGKDGFRFSLTVDYIPGPDEQQKLVAEYLRPQLKKVGVDVKVRASSDFPNWAERISNWDFELTMDLVFNWGDPVIGVHRTYLCDNIRKGVIWSNTQGYCNPEVDRLLEAAGVAKDREKRAELYARAQAIIVDEAPIVFINVDSLRTVHKTDLKNPPLSIWGSLSPMDETYWE